MCGQSSRSGVRDQSAQLYYVNLMARYVPKSVVTTVIIFLGDLIIGLLGLAQNEQYLHTRDYVPVHVSAIIEEEE